MTHVPVKKPWELLVDANAGDTRDRRIQRVINSRRFVHSVFRRRFMAYYEFKAAHGFGADFRRWE